MTADVVVIGAGTIGLASAWRLAQRGASVTVVDPSPGAGASTVAAGMLAPVTEARVGDEHLLALDMASWGRWPAFAAEVESASGREVGYRADGTLVAALDADDRAALDELVARQRSLGLDVTILRGRDARALEPALAPGVRAAALAAGERSVDPEALHAALLAAGGAVGVTHRQARVARILTAGGSGGEDALGDPDPGGPGGVSRLGGVGRLGALGDPDLGGRGDPAGGLRVRGVALDDGGEVLAPCVVLAAGCWSGGVEGVPPGAVPPVRPVKGQILTLRQPPGDPLVGRTVRGIVHGFSIYLVPRADGRLVCGATVEERGWDLRVTAGGAYELLREVLALVPGLDDAELVAVRSGLRPGSPDDLPMIGPASVGGLVVATGHYRNGILLAPVTADAVAAAVAGGALPPEVASCDPTRFARRAAGAEVPAGTGSW